MKIWETNKQKSKLTKIFLGLVLNLERKAYIQYVSTSKNSINYLFCHIWLFSMPMELFLTFTAPIVNRVFLTTLTYEDPTCIAYPPPLFQFFPKLPLLFLLPYFFGLMCYHTIVNVMLCWTILWSGYLSTSSTLLCVLCNKRSNLLKVWHGCHGFSYCSDLIPQNADKHTWNTQGPIYLHTSKNILTLPVICAQQLTILNWMNNFLIKNFTLQRFTMS